MLEYKKLSLPDKSDDNLSEYLNDKLEKLLDSRILGRYPASTEEYAKELLMLYIHAKTDFEEGVNVTEISKIKFEELLKKWDTLIPEVKSLILEDSFTNPSEVSEQFLLMRDEKIKNSQRADYVYSSSSSHTEHVILTDELDTVKEYSAIKRLEKLDFGKEDLDKLLDRDNKIFYKKYIGENGAKLPAGEKKRRQGKLYADGIFRIASNIENLLSFSEQEESLGEKEQYFRKEIISENIKVAISEQKKVRSVVSTNSNQVLSRTNFLRWQNAQTKEGGVLEGEPKFGPKSFLYALMLPQDVFVDAFDRELMLAQKAFSYAEKGRVFTFRQMYDAGLANYDTPEEKIKYSNDFHNLFLNDAFGKTTSMQNDHVIKLLKNAIEYYDTLEAELRESRREEEQKEEDVLLKAESEQSVPKKKRENINKRISTFDPKKVDKYIEKAAKSGLKCTKIINVGKIGTPDVGQDGLIYYVFESEKTPGIKIWEPIGQPANASLIFKTDKSVEDLAIDIKDKKVSLDDLVEQKMAVRAGHREGSIYNANRLALLFETLEDRDENKTISHIMREKLIEGYEKELVSLNELQSGAVKVIDKNQMPDATAYIQKIRSLRKEKVAALEEEAGIQVATLKNIRSKVKEIGEKAEESQNNNMESI